MIFKLRLTTTHFDAFHTTNDVFIALINLSFRFDFAEMSSIHENAHAKMIPRSFRMKNGFSLFSFADAHVFV